VTFAAIHTSSRQRTARIQGWITALKLTLLATFVVAGASIGWPNSGHLDDRTPLTGSLAASMMLSLVYISYAYTGWNTASYLAGEVVNPQRTLPRAIVLATAGVVVLYLGMNVVYALALSAADVRALVEDPNNRLEYKPDVVAPIAQIAARRLFGSKWAGLMSVAIGLMLLSSLSAYVLTGPRVVYAMARADQFPAFAGRLTRRAGTPLIATILQVIAGLILLWTGSFESLIIYASVGLAISSMLAVGAIYVLRRTRPDLPRPFRTPGYPITPAVYLVLTAALTYAAFMQRREASTYSLLSILAGIPIYYLWKISRHAKAAAGIPD
jgi:basic amino acid/polyamine antiporter, APA family